jgi:hypothetical protein
MTYFGSDPLAGYTPTWRQSSSSDVQTATNFSGGDDDDPLQGYTPNWRQQLSGSHGGATGDIDLRDDDDDPLAGYTPDWRKRHQASVVEAGAWWSRASRRGAAASAAHDQRHRHERASRRVSDGGRRRVS